MSGKRAIDTKVNGIKPVKLKDIILNARIL